MRVDLAKACSNEPEDAWMGERFVAAIMAP
jgi:hypothetical protein